VTLAGFVAGNLLGLSLSSHHRDIVGIKLQATNIQFQSETWKLCITGSAMWRIPFYRHWRSRKKCCMAVVGSYAPVAVAQLEKVRLLTCEKTTDTLGRRFDVCEDHAK
jgi:hypothetical protein